MNWILDVCSYAMIGWTIVKAIEFLYENVCDWLEAGRFNRDLRERVAKALMWRNGCSGTAALWQGDADAVIAALLGEKTCST